jgi:DNA-binding CsgD family transcriptional regulator
MRVLLAGPAPARQRLRAQLAAAGDAIEVAGEFGTAGEAAASPIAADAIVVAAGPSDGHDDGSEGMAVEGDEIAETLTPREEQVLELLAQGLPNKAIAGHLHISDQTVKFHVASIMGKLGAANRVETVRRAVRRGLVSL